jgi:putative membrane protein
MVIMSRLITLGAILVFLALGLLFHVRNDQFVTLDYYAGAIDLPFSLWMFISLALGSALGMLASLPAIVRLKRENARLARQVKVTERELNNLRVIPLRDTP